MKIYFPSLKITFTFFYYITLWIYFLGFPYLQELGFYLLMRQDFCSVTVDKLAVTRTLCLELFLTKKKKEFSLLSAVNILSNANGVYRTVIMGWHLHSILSGIFIIMCHLSYLLIMQTYMCINSTEEDKRVWILK